MPLPIDIIVMNPAELEAEADRLANEIQAAQALPETTLAERRTKWLTLAPLQGRAADVAIARSNP